LQKRLEYPLVHATKFVPRFFTDDRKLQRFSISKNLTMSLLVTGCGFMVMTLKPNNNPHTGRVLRHQTPREHDRCAHEWKLCCLFSRSLFIMNSLLTVRLLIKIFAWWFWDFYGMQYKERDLKCGLWEAGSSITMRLMTQRGQLDNSWQNIQFPPFHYLPDHLTSPILTFSIP
jgi:hypothetical protein